MEDFAHLVRFLPKIIFLVMAISWALIVISTRKELLKNAQFYDAINEIQGEFCLFLRSFSKENDKVQSPNVYSNIFLSRKGQANIDVYLYSKLKNVIPIIKIVDPESEKNHDVSFSRVKIDDKWQENVLELMHKSSLIIMNPLISDGFIWELNQIFKYNYLEKTLFVITEDPNKIGEKRRNNHFFNFLNSSYKVKIRHNKKKPFFIIEHLQTTTCLDLEEYALKRINNE